MVLIRSTDAEADIIGDVIADIFSDEHHVREKEVSYTFQRVQQVHEYIVSTWKSQMVCSNNNMF